MRNIFCITAIGCVCIGISRTIIHHKVENVVLEIFIANEFNENIRDRRVSMARILCASTSFSDIIFHFMKQHQTPNG